jgi:hypothetical protein
MKMVDGWNWLSVMSVMGFDVKGRRTVKFFCNILFLLHYSHGIVVLHVIHYLVKKDEQGIGDLLYLVSRRRKKSGHIFHTYNCFQDRQIPYKVLCIHEFNGLDPWMTIDKTACLPVSVSVYLSVCRYACLSVCLCA